MRKKYLKLKIKKDKISTLIYQNQPIKITLIEQLKKDLRLISQIDSTKVFIAKVKKAFRLLDKKMLL
jgi:hypothetical protein